MGSGSRAPVAPLPRGNLPGQRGRYLPAIMGPIRQGAKGQQMIWVLAAIGLAIVAGLVFFWSKGWPV